ncbi:MAG: glycosyltransferase family 4 protein [Planctomycetes bacterium]|nr:glycosyltransferase family 4 protein [Planctomycetota bacterium]
MNGDQPTIQIQVMSPHDAIGGGALHARGIAQGLRSAGLRVSLLCTGDGRPTRDPDYDEVFACQPRSWPLLWRFPPVGSLPFWYRRVPKTTAHVDAVFALSPVLAMATRWTLPNVPVLYCPAVLDQVEHPEAPRSPFTWLERQAFQQSRAVLLTCAAIRDAVERLYCPLRVPNDVRPLGIDREHALRVTRTRAELGVPPDARLLLTIGLINENKGQRHIARALARHAQPNWWWALLGDGPDIAVVREELRGSAIETRTLFLGQERTPANWLAAADILVAASRHETFGLAIAEALLAGVPVVLPDDRPPHTLSPLAATIRSHRLGLTYTRADPESLVQMLEAIMRNEDERRAMGRRAADYADEAFSWDGYVQRGLALLELECGKVAERAAHAGQLVEP